MTQTSGVPAVPLPGDVTMPLVGFGTWQLSGHGAYDAVRTALDVGYRHLDTATMYRNEAEIGRALRDSGVPREEVFVTTKLPPSAAGRESATLAASLQALDTPYVDLWLVHAPPPARALVPVWQAFLDVRGQGLARAVGVSNFSTAQLDEVTSATGQAPAVNQIPWSPYEHDERRVVEHRDRGVVIEGYSPLKGTDLADPVLVDIASAHGVTPAQVVLRWHVQHGIVVIPKSADPGRTAANLDLFGFTLDADEMERVDGISAVRRRHG